MIITHGSYMTCAASEAVFEKFGRLNEFKSQRAKHAVFTMRQSHG